MDFGTCSSHLLPNFTYFRNLLTPDAIRGILCSDYAVLFPELVQHHRSCRERNECRQKHDFSETQTLTKLPAEETTVQRPLNTSSCAAAPFRHILPNQSETSSRMPPGLCIFCWRTNASNVKTITTLTIETAHRHKQSYCNSTFCRSPLFVLRHWMRTSHNSHIGDKCLGMKTPVYPIKQ